MSVAVILGLVASALSLYSTVPQVMRAVRTRSVVGISWSSMLLSLATFTLWVVYAFAVADAIMIVNNTLALALLGVLAVVVMRHGEPQSVWEPVVVVLASAVSSAWLVDATNAFTLAMVGTAASSVRMLPQTRLAVSGAPLDGLSPASLALAWVSGGLWLGYGVLVGDLALVLVSAIVMVLQGVVLAYRVLPQRGTVMPAGVPAATPAGVPVVSPEASPVAAAVEVELAA